MSEIDERQTKANNNKAVTPAESHLALAPLVLVAGEKIVEGIVLDKLLLMFPASAAGAAVGFGLQKLIDTAYRSNGGPPTHKPILLPTSEIKRTLTHSSSTDKTSQPGKQPINVFHQPFNISARVASSAAKYNSQETIDLLSHKKADGLPRNFRPGRAETPHLGFISTSGESDSYEKVLAYIRGLDWRTPGGRLSESSNNTPPRTAVASASTGASRSTSSTTNTRADTRRAGDSILHHLDWGTFCRLAASNTNDIVVTLADEVMDENLTFPQFKNRVSQAFPDQGQHLAPSLWDAIWSFIGKSYPLQFISPLVEALSTHPKPSLQKEEFINWARNHGLGAEIVAYRIADFFANNRVSVSKESLLTELRKRADALTRSLLVDERNNLGRNEARYKILAQQRGLAIEYSRTTAHQIHDSISDIFEAAFERHINGTPERMLQSGFLPGTLPPGAQPIVIELIIDGFQPLLDHKEVAFGDNSDARSRSEVLRELSKKDLTDPGNWFFLLRYRDRTGTHDTFVPTTALLRSELEQLTQVLKARAQTVSRLVSEAADYSEMDLAMREEYSNVSVAETTKLYDSGDPLVRKTNPFVNEPGFREVMLRFKDFYFPRDHWWINLTDVVGHLMLHEGEVRGQPATIAQEIQSNAYQASSHGLRHRITALPENFEIVPIRSYGIERFMVLSPYLARRTAVAPKVNFKLFENPKDAEDATIKYLNSVAPTFSPFSGTEPELLLKIALQQTAIRGNTVFGWTPGAVQRERWLGNQIFNANRIVWMKLQGSDSYEIGLNIEHERTESSTTLFLTGKQLDAAFGKETATRIRRNEGALPLLETLRSFKTMREAHYQNFQLNSDLFDVQNIGMLNGHFPVFGQFLESYYDRGIPQRLARQTRSLEPSPIQMGNGSTPFHSITMSQELRKVLIFGGLPVLGNSFASLKSRADQKYSEFKQTAKEARQRLNHEIETNKK